MAKQKKTYKVGRDAGTGKFIPVKEAQRRKKTAVVETMDDRNSFALSFSGLRAVLLERTF